MEREGHTPLFFFVTAGVWGGTKREYFPKSADQAPFNVPA